MFEFFTYLLSGENILAGSGSMYITMLLIITDGALAVM